MFNPDLVRHQFPALMSDAIHFDNPGGTQVAQQTVSRIQNYLQFTNANHGGAFHTSEESDAIVAQTRQTLADWFNAARPEEIVFGPNMTTLTLHLSRSLARTLQPGDEIIVTRLDHDANVAPWLLIAEDRGCTVRWVDFDPADCRLKLDTLEHAISPRTRIVAVGYASNAVGTINDVRRIVQIAHGTGALCYVDAVQYAAHGPIDVQNLDCDFLVCSAYKFFGPHLGILYGKYDVLDRLTAYKVRTSGNQPPDKWETGTQSFEAIAGTLGALDYFHWVGETFGDDYADLAAIAGRRQTFHRAMRAIQDYEVTLSRALIEGLSSVPGLKIWGITNPEQVDQRVATVSLTLEGWQPHDVAYALGCEGIYLWDGNFYALEVTRRLELEDHGGLVRVGAVHYNTQAEINRLVSALQRLSEQHHSH